MPDLTGRDADAGAPAPLDAGATRLRGLAGLLLTLAAVSAVIVLAAAVVVPPIALPDGARAFVDGARFIGPPLALITGMLARRQGRLRQRQRQRQRPSDPERDGAAVVFRTMLLVAASLMALGVVSALWSALVLSAGDLLR